MTLTQRFWEHTSLDDMSDAEWEALCDGCGRCCMQKLEDEDTGEVHFTNIACRLLDTQSCRCRSYKDRFQYVPDCLAVRPLNAEKLSWLPNSCAYKRLHNGQPLENWHPLISGDRSTVRRASISVANRCVCETSVPLSHWVEHVVEWKK